jgi:hypothetical protein
VQWWWWWYCMWLWWGKGWHHVEEELERFEQNQGGPLLGAGRILPPGSIEGYPSSREPPHEYARRILRKTNVDDSSCHTKCTQGLRRRRRPASEERGEPPILPSPRMARDAAGSRNLRSGQAKEPPTRKRRRIGDRADWGTSRVARPRNLRSGQAEEPPTRKRRRICDRVEDPSLRPAEALDRGHT